MYMRIVTAIIATVSWSMDAIHCEATLPDQDSFPVSIRVDVSHAMGPLRGVWRFFGADEPNYAYMKDGRKLLRQLGELAPREVFFRAHNLLTSGPGYPALKWGSTNVYTD
jgi:xylan 1,4-beta-xylosidase